MLTEARDAAKRLGEIAEDNVKQLAADMGEPYTTANEMYWGTMGNLTKPNGGALDSNAPELHALHQLANSVPRLHRNQWSEAHAICGRLFEGLKGGEELGLGPLLHLDVAQEEDRAEAMRRAAEFQKVPAAYAPALGDVVKAIMAHYRHRESRHRWAMTYCYAVACVCERCKADPWSPSEQVEQQA
jgi:hypothetical protein